MAATSKTAATPKQVKKTTLCLATYMSPGLPLRLFELARDFLEEETGMETTLLYESRWTGPPAGRVDLFESDKVDLAFMSSTSFLNLKERGSKVELCHAAPLHPHPMAGGRPVYFSELTILKENEERYKEFESLKGCNWAYSDEDSLSGNHVMLAALKKHGFNASFFGSTLRSGSHLNSIQLVLNGQADVAAVDSNVLAEFGRAHPDQMGRLHKVSSLGPMPIYPIVFNSRLPAALKTKITKGFLNMAKKGNWGQRLQDEGVLGYAEVDESFYNMEKKIEGLVTNMTVHPAYY